MKPAVLAAAFALLPLLLAAQDATPAPTSTPPPVESGTAKPPSKKPKKPEKPGKFIDSNPALLYWQASALLPELKLPQTKLMTDVLEGRLPASDPSVAAFLAGTRRGLDRFARAARGKQPCVWGTTIDEGPFAPMPHLSMMQQMCRLALVQAEVYYAAGDLEAAWQWTKHVHAAARHVGADPLLITAIIQFGIEQQALRLSAKYALRMDVDHGDDIVRALKAMPPLRTVREALTGEHAMAEWTRLMVLGIQNSPESEKAMLEMAQTTLNAQSEDSSAAKSLAAKQALASVGEWKELTEQGRALQARVEAASTKSWTEYQADLQQIHASLASASPSLKNTLPAFEGAMRKQFETRTLQNMLFAVLQPPADGHEDGEMKRFTDAFEGKPLILNRSKEPWIISMQGNVNGKPLELQVGR